MMKRLGLFSAVHLLVSLLFFFFAATCLLIATNPSLRIDIAQDCLLSAKWPFRLALFFSFMGIGLTALFYRFYGHRYYQLKMQCQQTEIDRAIIQRYLRDYWRENFPQASWTPEVVIAGKNRLEIIAQLPPIEGEDEEESLYKRLENELGVLLARHLNHEEDFELTLIAKT